MVKRVAELSNGNVLVEVEPVTLGRIERFGGILAAVEECLPFLAPATRPAEAPTARQAAPTRPVTPRKAVKPATRPTVARESGKKAPAKPTFTPKACAVCGEQFQPGGPAAKMCVACSSAADRVSKRIGKMPAQPSADERRRMILIEAGKAAQPQPAAAQPVFCRECGVKTAVYGPAKLCPACENATAQRKKGV